MIIVQPMGGRDDAIDGAESGKISITFTVLVWSQGVSQDATPTQINNDGWQWLCNIIDILRRQIKKKQYVSGLQLTYPLKYEVYPDKEDAIFPTGYFSGSVTADFLYPNAGYTDFNNFIQ